ncbi:hypothetical protein F2P81_006457 [Scophthalmus maximus]|uniref:Uncharacterized protein n=1 Tax=Scophthalmus maximus TaxID=52904 RepID=A0A6A4T6Q9_SCOMX|nr:hypothetical protein F2P81_006457 [Scophthalmus maximus]
MRRKKFRCKLNKRRPDYGNDIHKNPVAGNVSPALNFSGLRRMIRRGVRRAAASRHRYTMSKHRAVMRRSAEDRASRVAAVTVDVVAERTQLVLADSGAVCQLVSRLSNGFRQHLNEDLNTQDSESNIIPATHLPVRGL